jgi:hypothetical protein
MSISGVPSSIFSPSQSTSASSTIQQEFKQLGQSLQSGNLSSAQSEFASLQEAFSQAASDSTASSTAGSTTAGSTATNSNSITQTFNQLASDLKSGNLTAAQKDYSSIQQDFKAKGGPAKNHLHDHNRTSTGGLGSDPTSGTDATSGSDTTNQNSLQQDPSQASQTGSSSTSAAAQQAYATLQQELQQLALGGNLSAQASVLSIQSAVSLDA